MSLQLSNSNCRPSFGMNGIKVCTYIVCAWLLWFHVLPWVHLYVNVFGFGTCEVKHDITRESFQSCKSRNVSQIITDLGLMCVFAFSI